MNDIFISYSREDQDRLLPLVDAFEKMGWSVFWDRKISQGVSWRHVIDSEIRNSRSLVVVWTKNSITSDWVQEEAEIGRRRRILIPVLLDNVEPPFGFGMIQSANLAVWNGDSSSPNFIQLVEDIGCILGPAPKSVKEAEQRHRRLETEAQHKAGEGRHREQERQPSEEEVKRKAEEETQKRIEEERSRAGKFFFSYGRADAEFVLKLAADLRSNGTNVWLDQLDIPGGARWDRAVEEALHASQCLLVVLSPDSVASNNVMDEVSFGLEADKRIVPILFKNCAVPFRLKRLHYIDFRAGYDDGFKRLVQALKPVDQLTTPWSELGEKVKEGETELLAGLRRKMLVSHSSWDLQEVQYELDAYLAKFPHSTEGRLLKDKMQAAMRHAEDMERPKAMPRPQAAPPRMKLNLLFILVILGIIVFLLSRFF